MDVLPKIAEPKIVLNIQNRTDRSYFKMETKRIFMFAVVAVVVVPHMTTSEQSYKIN